MHVDTTRRTYTAADGTVHQYRRALLRRSFRDESGRACKETLANLSELPDAAIEAVKKILAGGVLVEAGSDVTVERSLPHGDVAAVDAMASRLGIKKLLGPASRQRDLVYALIVSRVVRPRSKLSTLAWWSDTTLGGDLGVADAATDEVYAAMDWLAERQKAIERTLAARHLTNGGIAMFDLSSSWVEGHHCPLGAHGHSRDSKRGLAQIEYGLLTDPVGRPVAVKVFPGNTSDSTSFIDVITMVRQDFGLDRMILVGDRGMITNARIKDLRGHEGLDWVTALRAPAIAALARDDGPLQMSLFDTQNFAAITHPDYPGERLICCRNPALAEQRARKREELLAATEKDLEKIAARVSAGRLRDAAEIGMRTGKIINKRKVAEHFVLDIADGAFTYHRDQAKISAEAALDGIYVIRTSVEADTLTDPDSIRTYKNLAHVERDFRSIKTDDLDLRPIYHYLETRVRAHVLICMLAAYLTWHLRQTLAELTYTDECIPERPDPVAPAPRSPAAHHKDATKLTNGKLPVRSFRDLLTHLATLTRQTLTISGHHIEKITHPTPTQRRVFELLDSPIPLTLSAT